MSSGDRNDHRMEWKSSQQNSFQEEPPMNEGDEAVQATNDDATTCKRSATHLGYWNDPYLKHFTRGQIVRKAPEINRGYFARTFGMYHLILDAFDKISKAERRLSSPSPLAEVMGPPGTATGIGGRRPSGEEKVSKVQIVNLGCGYDTLYWRLKKEEKLIMSKRHVQISTYIDVDFPATSMKKVNLVKNTPDLVSQLSSDDGEISVSRFDLHSFSYHIVGTDLRDLNQVNAKLASCGLKNDEITIFISECVLVYMEAKTSEALLQWIAERFKTSLFINYEQMNMTDKFAEVMLKNLTLRGCLLPGVNHCKDLESQKKRFLEAGWTSAKGWTMNEVYSCIPKKELERIESIELLDEQELLKQLFEHYCITVAVNSQGKCSFGLELVGFE